MENDKYLKRIKVSAYSGYKLNERPVSFFLKKRYNEVKLIIETWRDPDNDFFKVKADDGKEYIFKVEQSIGSVVPWMTRHLPR